MANNWARLLQDLLVKHQTGLQNIVDQEGALRLRSQRGLYDAGQERKETLSNINVNAADRGMLNSGATIGSQAQSRGVFDTLMSRIKEDESIGLAQLARQRLGLQNAYASGEADIRQGQADEAAAAALAKQQAEQEAAMQAAANAQAAAQTPVGYGSGGGGSSGGGSGSYGESPDDFAARAMAYMRAVQGNNRNLGDERRYSFGPPPAVAANNGANMAGQALRGALSGAASNIANALGGRRTPTPTRYNIRRY